MPVRSNKSVIWKDTKAQSLQTPQECVGLNRQKHLTRPTRDRPLGIARVLNRAREPARILNRAREPARVLNRAREPARVLTRAREPARVQNRAREWLGIARVLNRAREPKKQVKSKQ